MSIAVSPYPGSNGSTYGYARALPVGSRSASPRSPARVRDVRRIHAASERTWEGARAVYRGVVALTHLLRRADQAPRARCGLRRPWARRGPVDQPDPVTAVVRGSVEYDVVLDGRDGDCTCPVGQRGQFCKHLVATVMTLDDRATNSVADDLEDEDDGRVTPEELAELVDSLRVRGHPDYWKANALGEYCERRRRSTRACVARRHRHDLLPLLECGIDLVTRGMLRSDDSSGLQGIALQQLFDLHARAALIGSMNPGRLARWMAEDWLRRTRRHPHRSRRLRRGSGERGLAATPEASAPRCRSPRRLRGADARDDWRCRVGHPCDHRAGRGPLDNGHALPTPGPHPLRGRRAGRGPVLRRAGLRHLLDGARGRAALRGGAIADSAAISRRPWSSVAVSSPPSRPRRRTARSNEPPDPWVAGG